MTVDTYIKDLLDLYSLVTVLGEKNDCQVLRLRNKQTGQDLVLRSFSEAVDA